MNNDNPWCDQARASPWCDQARAGGRARTALVAIFVLGAGAHSAWAHDLFFRARQYVLAPRSSVVIDVLSGTFSRSENAITRDRLSELVLAGPGGRRPLDLEQWTEHEPKSTLRVAVEDDGTYVVGAVVRPRLQELSGKEFTAYLEEEGLDDVVAARAAQKRPDEPSRERYSKYLKAIFQVGDAAEAAPAALGHAAEIIPERNPYRLAPGDRLPVRCLIDGQPWARKVVFAGGRRGTSDQRFPPQRLVTDDEGRATVQVTGYGVWYVKLVAMREVADPEANYESKWATLSFAVLAEKGKETGTTKTEVHEPRVTSEAY
jgi:Domain of unknown function (DUF4198)